MAQSWGCNQKAIPWALELQQQPNRSTPPEFRQAQFPSHKSKPKNDFGCDILNQSRSFVPSSCNWRKSPTSTNGSDQQDEICEGMCKTLANFHADDSNWRIQGEWRGSIPPSNKGGAPWCRSSKETREPIKTKRGPTMQTVGSLPEGPRNTIT
ncbi:hypothetical protein Salat_2540100 [Sesamum alatum]|uniref:Uncharacterized protein n=1 Tax=Sesamum alatum TaxID=300844 RepID=A0AAE1XSI4_9LAMI|nr:hypothetical protein Salat_2540100 [Sesamum alatum]